MPSTDAGDPATTPPAPMTSAVEVGLLPAAMGTGDPLVPRPPWADYFVEIARAVAQRSDCRRRQVGAVLVDEGHRIVGTGYTGAPSGHPGCLEGACPRGLLTYEQISEFSDYDAGPGRCISVHAEANALLYARRDLRGCTAYVTCQPCPTCAKLLAGAGLSRAVFPVDHTDWHSPLVSLDLHDPPAVADPAGHAEPLSDRTNSATT